MFIIKAPYPSFQVTALLPSPQWGDSMAATGTMQSMHMMDGTRFTYVTSRNGRKRYQWDFTISRAKALELQSFYNAYYGAQVQVITHDDDTLNGYLINNPFEFTGSGRAVDWPEGETMGITIELEEAS